MWPNALISSNRESLMIPASSTETATRQCLLALEPRQSPSSGERHSVQLVRSKTKLTNLFSHENPEGPA
jgi:hypothetical protein